MKNRFHDFRENNLDYCLNIKKSQAFNESTSITVNVLIKHVAILLNSITILLEPKVCYKQRKQYMCLIFTT